MADWLPMFWVSAASGQTVHPMSASTSFPSTRLFAAPRAIHMKPLAIVDGVASRAEREVVAEIVNLLVAAVLAKPSGQRDLMRPAAINAARRQLALPAHARTVA